jgi:hypothetical protein
MPDDRIAKAGVAFLRRRPGDHVVSLEPALKRLPKLPGRKPLGYCF